jgi:hypothetical protein
MKTLKIKYNSGLLAILCDQCDRIIKVGSEFTDEEMNAATSGKPIKLPAQYCFEHDPAYKKIKLTKISDDAFEGRHPNGIYAGYIKSGYMKDLPKIGERFYVIGSLFSTSIVTKELDENNIFKTTYSTYKIEYLDDEK